MENKTNQIEEMTLTKLDDSKPFFNSIVSSLFFNKDNFETGQRMASILAHSDMVPESYRATNEANEKKAIANCYIALTIAYTHNVHPSIVMQNLYMVKGKPNWAGKYLIACFNVCGKYEPITYEDNIDTEPDFRNWWCQAKSRVLATGKEIRGTKISYAMAYAEGWAKSNPKWQNITGQMLKYRAGKWLVESHAPEISLGYMTDDEREDVELTEAFMARQNQSAANAQTTIVDAEAEVIQETQPQVQQTAPQQIEEPKGKAITFDSCVQNFDEFIKAKNYERAEKVIKFMRSNTAFSDRADEINGLDKRLTSVLSENEIK